MKHLVIAGGGFAGARLARLLGKQKGLNITLINDSPDFRYSPALYRTVTGIKLGTARLPLEWMLLDANNVNIITGRVKKIHKESKRIKLEDGQTIDYDYAVLALGSVTTYFGISGLDNHSFGVKSFEEVAELRHHIHDKLTDKDVQEQNYVIAGAGPTGVEVAGGLSNYLKKINKKHKVRKSKVNIYLVEAGPRILPQLTERGSRLAQKRLEKLGVTILTNTAVKSETVNNLRTSAGLIKTHNVIWTAGTTNNPFFKDNEVEFEFDKRGKVIANKRLQVDSGLYVCGDNVSTPFSGLAQTAIWHANFIAKDIKARLKSKKRKNQKDSYPITVIPIGNAYSILRYRNLVLHGRYISLIRRIADIIGYTDIMGPLRALTIWSNSDKTEEHCRICNRA
jgi:NADH dehydrogenase